MSLLQAIITMSVAGAMSWLVDKYLPINATIKTIFNVAIVVIVWFLALEVFVNYCI